MVRLQFTVCSALPQGALQSSVAQIVTFMQENATIVITTMVITTMVITTMVITCMGIDECSV